MSMTDQEAFDTVLHALRKQGRASVGSDGRCAYRGADGAKCAAGHLLPDSEYSPDMEQRGIYYIAFFCSLGPSLGLLGDLQNAHDGFLHSGSLRLWENRMESIAAHRGLAYTPPASQGRAER